MKRHLKNLFIAELVVCYGPALLVLVMGLTSTSISTVTLSIHGVSPLLLAALIMGIIGGITALISMLLKFVHVNSDILSETSLKVISILGISSSIALATFSMEFLWQWQMLIFILPLVATVHLFYLGRHHLLARSDMVTE